jgi:hypothetical protein
MRQHEVEQMLVELIGEVRSESTAQVVPAEDFRASCRIVGIFRCWLTQRFADAPDNS